MMIILGDGTFYLKYNLFSICNALLMFACRERWSCLSCRLGVLGPQGYLFFEWCLLQFVFYAFSDYCPTGRLLLDSCDAAPRSSPGCVWGCLRPAQGS